MDFGEFMASWEPIPRTEDNHEAHPITTVPLSSRPARNAGDNFTNPDGSETWLDPTKFTGKTVSKSLSNEPNFNDRLVTSTEIEYSNDIPKENTNPDASASGIATATTDAGCTRKLKRKVMVLPPSESYRGFCSVDDIRNVDKRPWENLSQVKSQKVKQKIETASSQVNSKQVKIMRLVSPERIASSVGVKNRKICTLQSSPVRDFNVKMIKPSLNKISEPPPNQNKYRSDTTTKSTSISSSSKAITQRKSLETKKKVMKISSYDNRRHEDFDDHFNNLLKEAKAINSQMESLKKSTLDGENSDDVQIKVAPHKPKFVKKLGNTFSSPQKAIKKPTEREDDTNVDKKNDITKKYDRQAALSYMKQKKALMKEKQAKEIDKKRCDEENKQQKLQELQVTRLKLLSNARKKKDATEARRNWEGPVNGESSPPPPLPIHRSNSDVKIRHISRKPGTEQNSCTKSNTIKQSVENIEIGPSFVPVNGENCVNPTWKTKSTKQNVENLEVGPSFVGVAGNCINSNRKTNSNRQNVHSTEFVPSFVVVNEGNCVNSNRKSNFTKQHVENIEISPSFVPINGENYLNLKEVGNHDGGINCEEQVVRGPVASKSKDSIADRNENFENNCPPNLRSREILGSKSVGIFDEAEVQKQQIEENLEENKINSNSSSFVPFYEDEMREITNQINQIGAALKNITGRKVVDKTVGSEDDKKGNRGRTDEDVTKKNDERRSGGDVSKTPVENKGSWCELLRSKDRSRKERKKQYEEENESSDQPHTTTQDESISGGPINELTDEENLYQALPNESSHRQHTSTKPAKDEKIVPQFIKALDYEPNPLNFITAYRSKLDMLKRQNKRDRISAEGNRNKSAVQKNFPHFKTCSGSKFKENLTLKDLETCPENGLSSRRNTQNRIYVLTDESSDLVSRQNVFQPLLLNDLKLDLPPSLKSDTTSGKNSTTDGCESEEIIVNGTVGKENNFGNRIVDDRLFKAKSDSQLEKDKQQRLFVSDSVKSLTLSHSLTTLENKMAAETKTKNEKSGSSGSSMSLSAPNDCVRVSGSTVWRENVGVGGGTSWRDNVSDGGPFRRENDGVRLANSDAVEFVEPKRVCRERPRKTTLPSGAQLEGGGVLEIGNVFSPAAIHLQFQAELSKLDAYEVGLQQLTDSERLHNMALKSLHNQAKYEKLHKSTSIDNFDGKQNTQHSAASNHSDVDEPIVLTSSHHSVSSSSLSSSSNPTNHRDSRQKELSSSLRTVAESISSDSQHVKQVSESLKKPSDRLFDDTSLRRSFEKVGSSLNLPVPELQPPGDSNLGVMNPSEGPQHSSILEQTIATLISNPGAQVLDSLLNESNGLEQLLSSAHALTPLFDEQSSCGSPFPSSCSNSIFDKCISYEEARSDHQLNMYKSKEKELINRVKVQVSWLEFQKKRLKQKGHEDEAKNIKKKQRGLILKSQQIREEIHRLMKAEKMASEERRKLLHQQKLRAMHQFSVKDSSKKRKTNEVALKKSLQSLSSSTTSIAESLLTGEEASAFSEPKSLVVEEQKRHLLERKKAAIGRNRNSDVLSPNKRRFEEKELNLEEVDHRNIKSPKHTVSQSVLDRSTSPFAISSIESELVETTGVGLEAVKSHSETDPTEHTHREAQTDNDNSVPEELAKSNHSDSVDSHITEELHQYSESTFEQPSFTIHSRQPTPLKTRTDQSDSRSSQTKTASERRTTLSNMMIPIKVALSPRLQGYTRKRYSSGSEDSITFSQNETFSEQSDIEIRLSALHEQLRQRKLEADRLRREQKRAQRERLKCKEQALLKQIQIYDAYIEQVKKELEQEIESPSTVPIMKPQIKQPRFVDNDLRKPETVKPEPEKKTATSSDEEMSSLKSVSEASSLETTIQSLGQRDSSVDEQQITEKVSSSAASSPPLSEKFSKVLGENVPEVSSATLPKNHEEISKNLDPKMGDSESSPQSGEFSKNLASKIEDSVSEVSSVTSPLHSGQILKKLEGSASEKAENLGNVDSELDKTTEKWVAAAEFFKNKFSIDSPSNKSVERIRKTNNYDNNIKAGENIGEFSENNVNNVEILTSVESSYSEKSNSEETLSEVEEILGDNGENSVESEKNVESIENSVESEKKSDSVESIVEQIETKSEENGSDSFEVNTEKGFSGESLDRQEDFDKCLEEQNDRIRKSSSKSSVDDSEVNSSKSPDSTKNDNKSSVILEVTPDESLVIKTAQSVIDNEPSVLVDSSALNRSSLAVSTNSKSSPALELNPYDSADDTFESDVEASENESSVPESKHSSNLSIPDMFPLPMAGAEGHTSVSEGHKSVTDGQRSVTEGQRSVSEGHKSPEGHKSGDLLLNDVGKYFLVEKSVEVPDSTNQTLILSIVDCSERLICEERQDTSSLDEKSIRNETTVASLGDELIRNETSVASFGDELIHKEGSVANLDDKLIRNITPIANLEGKLIDDKTPVADLEEQLIRKETSVASLEDKLIRVGSFVANSEETLEDILVQSEVSEEDVLSEVSEALSYSKEDSEFDNLSAATKSCSSSSESSEFTVQKKAKVVSLNSTDSSEKSNQDYDGSFKEDEVIKVILVEKEKIINTGEKQDFVQVREEGEVEEDDEGGEVEEGDEEFEEDVEVDEEGEDEGGVKQDVSLLGENFAEKDVDKESRIDRITDNILLNLLNESLKFSPKVSASNKQLIHEENESLQISPKVSSSNKQLIHKKNCVLSDKIVNGSEEENDKDENEEKEEEDIQTTAPFITALRKENEREKRKSVESVTDKVLEEFIKDATDSVLKIYGKKTGEKLLKLQNTTDALPSSGSAASPPPGGISDLNSRSKDSSFDSNDGSWLKDEAENELEVSGGETEAFWLEEEMGLEHSCKEARELQLQRLQIEQEIKQLQQVQEQIPSYFYFREIPNKPPPPYTPPGQARAKIANDRIPTKQQEILAIVNSLTDYIYTQHSLGKDINALTPPRNLITREDSSQGIYKRFLFDLTKQIVIEAKYRYEEEDAQQRLPWQRIDYKQKCVVARELDELKKVVAKRVKVLYGFEPQVNRENLIVQWSKKHNKIDKFLVNELQEEECEWTDFSKQELMVKNKVAEDLMEQLIGETASVLEKSLARKVDRLSRMGVDDT